MPTRAFMCYCLRAFVRLTGLEPARRETLDPKSSASTNSATGASVVVKRGCKGSAFYRTVQIIGLKVSVQTL